MALGGDAGDASQEGRAHDGGSNRQVFPQRPDLNDATKIRDSAIAIVGS